jgi:hypothetical protein
MRRLLGLGTHMDGFVAAAVVAAYRLQSIRGHLILDFHNPNATAMT